MKNGEFPGNKKKLKKRNKKKERKKKKEKKKKEMKQTNKQKMTNLHELPNMNTPVLRTTQNMGIRVREPRIKFVLHILVARVARKQMTLVTIQKPHRAVQSPHQQTVSITRKAHTRHRGYCVVSKQQTKHISSMKR